MSYKLLIMKNNWYSGWKEYKIELNYDFMKRGKSVAVEKLNEKSNPEGYAELIRAILHLIYLSHHIS